MKFAYILMLSSAIGTFICSEMNASSNPASGATAAPRVDDLSEIEFGQASSLSRPITPTPEALAERLGSVFKAKDIAYDEEALLADLRQKPSEHRKRLLGHCNNASAPSAANRGATRSVDVSALLGGSGDVASDAYDVVKYANQLNHATSRKKAAEARCNLLKAIGSTAIAAGSLGYNIYTWVVGK